MDQVFSTVLWPKRVARRPQKCGKNNNLLTLGTEQMRLIRCLLYGSFQIEKCFGPYRSIQEVTVMFIIMVIINIGSMLYLHSLCVFLNHFFKKQVQVWSHSISSASCVSSSSWILFACQRLFQGFLDLPILFYYCQLSILTSQGLFDYFHWIFWL
jgi:hypothetical protein